MEGHTAYSKTQEDQHKVPKHPDINVWFYKKIAYHIFVFYGIWNMFRKTNQHRQRYKEFKPKSQKIGIFQLTVHERIKSLGNNVLFLNMNQQIFFNLIENI